MTKYKAIPQGYMTVGEVAKKMGVTVRALQYYDREGLFSPSCISDGGRRLYSDKDIVKLHQILALKSLGFSFDEIKNHLIAIDTPQKAIDALTEQSNVIQAQINALTQSLQAIEALKAEALQMQTVDFKKYADIIINLQMGNKNYGLIKYFSEDMLDYCHKRFDKKSGAAFLDKFDLIVEKAEHAYKSGIAPDSEQGQIIAKEFWQLITEFTDGDTSMLPQLMNLANTQTKDSGHNMQNTLNGFIEPALGVYFSNSSINPFEVKDE
ncbi:MAG: MerR family transcriptional regulator [Clostridiales bacterium]|nr:MerR family transcriptional regulator [Clostridiales bacterium]